MTKTVSLLLIILFLCVDKSFATTKVEVNTPGTLSSLLTDAQKDTCRSLVVSGKLNSADIRTLRQMAGYGEEGGKTGRLETLDLSDAKLVNDKEPFMILNAAKDSLALFLSAGKEVRTESYLGVSLQKFHHRDYDMYRRNMHWQKDSYVPAPGVMTVNGESVCYYLPKCYLGFKEDDSNPCSHVNNREYKYRRPMSGFHYSFMFGITEEDWKQMRRYKITKFRGHRICEHNGRYEMRVSCNSRYFFYDTFYKCSSLKTVIFPRRCRLDKTVEENTTHISYRYPEPIVKTSVYVSQQVYNMISIVGNDVEVSPFSIDCKNVKIKNDAKKEILAALSRLAIDKDGKSPVHLKYRVWIQTIEGDVDNVRNYYIDRDYSYVYCVEDRRVYRMSDELHDLLRSQGVTRKRILFREELY